uniref:Putative secreted protein n=1 Tax=Anopheles marajoara TaxID=58244 RepID=A0A2M4C9U9_9DIPT
MLSRTLHRVLPGGSLAAAVAAGAPGAAIENALLLHSESRTGGAFWRQITDVHTTPVQITVKPRIGTGDALHRGSAAVGRIYHTTTPYLGT